MTIQDELNIILSGIKDIESFQQTEVSHMKIIKTIKFTISNTQKHPGIATSQHLQFSCETKARDAVVKLS